MDYIIGKINQMRKDYQKQKYNARYIKNSDAGLG